MCLMRGLREKVYFSIQTEALRTALRAEGWWIEYVRKSRRSIRAMEAEHLFLA